MNQYGYSIMSRSDDEFEFAGPIGDVETRFNYMGYEISLRTDGGGCPEQVDVYCDNHIQCSCDSVEEAISWITAQ